ncbi:cytochrome b [Endozoicomonas arenosclerae]|uniref:cytochrome b n=1 Tax=Endozoicomonas arenosclerae TaxID=1633495 RepID=UPI0012947620|nr:cytochrome b/b6 domain-containing protein [Endozoicomonas arenosclerae]
MTTQYSSLARWLHWLSAGVILWASITGFYVALVSENPTMNQWIGFINVSLTTLFIPFFILRCFHTLLSKKPDTPNLSRLNQKIAHGMHQLIYLATAAVLVSGVMMMEREISIFGLVEIPHLLAEGELTTLFARAHKYSCVVLASLISLHIVAVIKHEISGIRIIRKMI